MAVERKESLCAGTGKSLGFYARVPKEAITGLKAIDAEKHTISEATWRSPSLVAGTGKPSLADLSRDKDSNFTPVGRSG